MGAVHSLNDICILMCRKGEALGRYFSAGEGLCFCTEIPVEVRNDTTLGFYAHDIQGFLALAGEELDYNIATRILSDGTNNAKLKAPPDHLVGPLALAYERCLRNESYRPIGEIEATEFASGLRYVLAGMRAITPQPAFETVHIEGSAYGTDGERFHETALDWSGIAHESLYLHNRSTRALLGLLSQVEGPIRVSKSETEYRFDFTGGIAILPEANSRINPELAKRIFEEPSLQSVTIDKGVLMRALNQCSALLLDRIIIAADNNGLKLWSEDTEVDWTMDLGLQLVQNKIRVDVACLKTALSRIGKQAVTLDFTGKRIRVSSLSTPQNRAVLVGYAS